MCIRDRDNSTWCQHDDNCHIKAARHHLGIFPPFPYGCRHTSRAGQRTRLNKGLTSSATVLPLLSVLISRSCPLSSPSPVRCHQPLLSVVISLSCPLSSEESGHGHLSRSPLALSQRWSPQAHVVVRPLLISLSNNQTVSKLISKSIRITSMHRVLSIKSNQRKVQ